MKREIEWKVVKQIRDAMATLDGSRTALAATTYEYATAKLMWLGHHFEWSELEVENSRDTGNMISTDEIRLAFDRVNMQAARAIIQGSLGWEPPAITGILSGATANPTDLSAVYWKTPSGGPYAHAQSGYDALLDAGYSPPFTWLLGHNLRGGLASKDNDYSDRPTRSLIAEAFEIDNIQFAPIKATAALRNDLTVYPMTEPDSVDSRWLMYKQDINNFSVQEVFQPKLTIEEKMDIRRRRFYGRLDYFFTVKIDHADAVINEADVDFAA